CVLANNYCLKGTGGTGVTGGTVNCLKNFASSRPSLLSLPSLLAADSNVASTRHRFFDKMSFFVIFDLIIEKTGV
ncbi:MAG: hypothetical protein IKP00_17935, partial [Victivallales bacterium]|nr:hypothetical protein [Victivallales bacterium]